MTDVAMGIEALLPAAQYSGSVTANTEAAFNAITWTDNRPKPTWQEVVAADPGPQAKVTMRQARLALHAAGLLPTVNAAIANADAVTQIFWDTSPTVGRNHPVLLGVATLLNLTSEQVDDLFALASTL